MIEVLGVKISMLDKPAVREALDSYLDSPRQHYVVTPNPEMIIKAQKDNEFKQILNEADLAVADGAGLQHAAALNLDEMPPRITGNDLMQMLAALCAEKKKKMFLLGGEALDVAKKSADILRDSYPGLEIDHDPAGPVYRSDNLVWHMNPAVLDHLKEFEPDVLMVALGHGKQEKWIKGFLPHLPSVKVAVGVGGAFDYLSGSVPRAPKFMREAGLEWVYRAYQEPQRLGRIFTAAIRFPLTVFWGKIKPQNKK